MKLSIIYCFKDRNLARVKRSISSLHPQLGSNDEIVFVDYGSNSKIKGEVEIYLQNFLRIKYIYVEAQGRLWNRSHALNIGVKNAVSEYVMMADIDLIFSQSFLNKLKSQFQTADLVNYQCHYLPQKFKKYDQLFKKPSKYAKRYKKSTQEGLGLMAVKKSLFEEVNGYDEYYRVWGMEDNDIIHRFQLIGKETTWLDKNKYFVFHQWHPISGIRTRKNIAKGWRSQMKLYFTQNQDKIGRRQNWGALPAKRISEGINVEQDLLFDLSSNTVLYSALFMKNVLHALKPGQVAKFIYKDNNSLKLESTKAFRFISFINKTSNRFKLPFMLESDLYYYGNLNSHYEVRDVFHFFILEAEKELQDYHLLTDRNTIELIIKK